MFHRLGSIGRLLNTGLRRTAVFCAAFSLTLSMTPEAMAQKTNAARTTDTPRDITKFGRDQYKLPGGTAVYALAKSYADRCNDGTLIAYVMCGREQNRALVVAAKDEAVVGHLFDILDETSFYDDGSAEQMTKFSSRPAHGDIHVKADQSRTVGFQLSNSASLQEACNLASEYYRRHKKSQREIGVRALLTGPQLYSEITR